MAGLVVAPQVLAAEEGVKVLRQGGNAADAAVTAALVQGVIDPQMCGLGGFGVALIYEAHSKRIECLAFHARAGSKATATMWADRVLREAPDGFGFFLRDAVNDVGAASVGVPGTVAGLHALLERYGTWTWAQVLEPAIRIASEGFVVSAELARSWKARERYPERPSLLQRLQLSPEAHRLFLKPNGAPYDAGETLRNPDLARTLQTLADQGPKEFYSGSVAAAIIAELETHGGHITPTDLVNYRVRWHPPVRVPYRGYEVVSAPLPAGGVTVAQVLRLLEGFDLRRMGHNSPDYLFTVAQAFKAAFTAKVHHHGDPEFVAVPVDDLLSEAWAAQWRARIAAGEVLSVPRWGSHDPHGTTHLTVIDADGNIVALTHTLGSSSGVIPRGTGFMLNNAMVGFHPLPGHPNSIAPGKARVSGMAPTFVLRDGEPVLVLGAPGGARIVSGIVQVLLNIVEFGMTPTEAVTAPRFDAQLHAIECHARIPSWVLDKVQRRGQPCVKLPQSYGGIASVQVAQYRDGRWVGASDPAGGGAAFSPD
ncbi:Gamma-glutamyltranspeptidase [bacterium HR17]|uniref:Glutathione hydrolase proenzyme n=1 Tax=Candidatus Fervidibacter japonicus TaxID=2035412 RepID=A0A2H5XA06_9BACT|nr:Gamma-glutamyltranspeptidase [bacterium HR17]